MEGNLRTTNFKEKGGIQFKLLHKILPSLPVLHHINPDISPTCCWCGERGTLLHLFITCPSIQPALTLLHSVLHRLLPELDLNFDLDWTLIPHAKGRCRGTVQLGNYLIICRTNVIHWLCRTCRSPTLSPSGATDYNVKSFLNSNITNFVTIHPIFSRNGRSITHYSPSSTMKSHGWSYTVISLLPTPSIYLSFPPLPPPPPTLGMGFARPLWRDKVYTWPIPALYPPHPHPHPFPIPILIPSRSPPISSIPPITHDYAYLQFNFFAL